MNKNARIALPGKFKYLALGASALVLFPVHLSASNVQTNWVEHWITNTVQVQMQANRFVTEYHTNWVEQVHTNVLDVFATNYVAKTFTNLVDVYTTNHFVKNLTNKFIVDLVQTNFVRAYRTNLQALNVTNWTTVLMFKTNWITQPMTNTVEIDMPTPTSHHAVVPEPASPENRSPASQENGDEPLIIEASRGSRTATNGQIDVRLSVRWANGRKSPLEILQWRAEREDGSFLCFGQEPEFKHAFPAGTYKIQVRVHQDSGDPLVGRGNLTLNAREVLIAQKPSVKKSAT